MTAKIRPFLVVRGAAPIGFPDAQCTAKIYEKDGSDAATGVDDLVLGSVGSLGYFLPEDANETSGCVVDIQTTPDADSIAGTGAMVHNRICHTATRLLDGRVLVVGGVITSPTQGQPSTNTCEIYDPTTGAWTATGSLATGRHNHTAELLSTGKVLVVAGQTTYLVPNSNISSCELFDPATGTWASANAIPGEGRTTHSSVVLNSGLVLVAGGSVSDYPYYTGSAYLYDPAPGTWSSAGAMSYGRAPCKCVLLHDGNVLFAGGNGSTPLTDLYLSATNTWTTSTAMNVPYRNLFEMVTLDDGRVFVAGGYNFSNHQYQSVAEAYYPKLASWVPQYPMNQTRWNYSAVRVGSCVVLLGCEQTSNNGAIVTYNPLSNVWILSTCLTPGYGCRAVALTDGTVLACGGLAPSTGLPAGAAVFSPGYPTLPLSRIVRPVYSSDNSNQFWAWHLVDDSDPTAPWAGAVPTIVDYVDSAGVAMTPVPTVASIGNGLFVATPSGADIAAGVSGRLVCAAGSVLADEAGAPEGRLKCALAVSAYSAPVALALVAPDRKSVV
jgi:hypothetical protein